MVTEKRRVVLIYHPEFDAPGAAGVRAAADFATEISAGQRAVLEEHPDKVSPEAVAYMRALRFHVCTVDGTILK